MKIIGDSKNKGLLKNWVFWLILITIIAIVIRSIPGWIYSAWGCDFGIYFGITKSVVETKILFPPYSGWGASYNEFPVLYFVNAIAQWITGIDIYVIMPKLTPIFGGLSVLIFYFLINELFKNKKIALISSLFFAVIPFHVYQTSHASPLTMGHFFMMLSMYFFVKYRSNIKYSIPLFISTILLIMSHHLTTYFYLIILIFVVFIENIKSSTWTETIKKDIFYLTITSIIMFAYWAFVATTVFDSFIRSGFSIAGFKLESIHILIIFYIFFFGMFGFIKLLKKQYPNGIYQNLKNKFLQLREKIYPNKIGNLLWFRSKKINEKYILKFSIMLTVSLIAMTIFLFVKLPWTNFTLTVESIVYSIPLMVTFALAVAGFKYTYEQKNGLLIIGWFSAVAISFAFALITNNDILLPDRHIEYLMAPIAIMAVFGLGGIFSDPSYKELLSDLPTKKKIKTYKKNPLIIALVIVILAVSMASTTYVVYQSLNVAVEEITSQDASVIKWVTENLNYNDTMIASDHRLARLVEAYGFNTTKDKTTEIWESEKLDDYVDELLGIGKNHACITHVIIDEKMKNDVVHVYFGDIKYMTNKTWTGGYDKFKQEPFKLIYRNESEEIDPISNESINWAEVYEVNWTYINEIYLPNIK